MRSVRRAIEAAGFCAGGRAGRSHDQGHRQRRRATSLARASSAWWPASSSSPPQSEPPRGERSLRRLQLQADVHGRGRHVNLHALRPPYSGPARMHPRTRPPPQSTPPTPLQTVPPPSSRNVSTKKPLALPTAQHGHCFCTSVAAAPKPQQGVEPGLAFRPAPPVGRRHRTDALRQPTTAQGAIASLLPPNAAARCSRAGVWCRSPCTSAPLPQLSSHPPPQV